MDNDFGDYLDVLGSCVLFSGIGAADISAVVGCLAPQRRGFAKGEYIFSAEEKVGFVGIVLAGSVHVVREDYWGNRSIIARAGAGDTFAEAFACAETEKSPVSAVAGEACLVMLFDYARVSRSCKSACAFHAALIRNMLYVLAQKNIMLTEKIQHLTQKTTREKLLSYFSEQARRAGSSEFEIPFDRQELADYLSVERSAMAHEISRLRRQGALACEKRRVELYGGGRFVI